VKLTEGGVTKDQYRMTIVDLNNLGYRDEPFVLAQNVAQVCHMKDMSSKQKKRNNQQMDEPKRHIVLSGKRNIIGVEDKIDVSEDCNKFVEIPPFAVNADPCILLASEDYPYLRHDHNQGSYVKRKSITVPVVDADLMYYNHYSLFIKFVVNNFYILIICS